LGLQTARRLAPSHPQALDNIAANIAAASLALQLLAVAWRLLGQLVALESLVFVLTRPRILVWLHEMLASLAVKLAGPLASLGILEEPIDEGECLIRMA
jgi:hypothetical protein